MGVGDDVGEIGGEATTTTTTAASSSSTGGGWTPIVLSRLEGLLGAGLGRGKVRSALPTVPTLRRRLALLLRLGRALRLLVVSGGGTGGGRRITSLR